MIGGSHNYGITKTIRYICLIYNRLMLLRRVSRWINCSNLSLLMLSIKCHRDLNGISRLTFLRATYRNMPYVYYISPTNIYVATRVRGSHLVIIAKPGACHFPFFFRKNQSNTVIKDTLRKAAATLSKDIRAFKQNANT